MSLTEISVRVAIVAVLALVALIVIGWRRAATDYPRQSNRSVAARSDAAPDSPRLPGSDDSAVTEHLGRATTRKLLDVVGLGSIAAFVGILVALVTSMTIAWMVTALLNRL